ncbi:MAG: glycine--tRNA ligase subunit alpha [Acidobacteria bacterium]|nr:MAG: glycine--tRNA ligase subunit alpha [Acidobacteriota bacterium]
MSRAADVVARLTRFWAGEGCALLTSCDLPVTSGLLHPRAFLPLACGVAGRLAYPQPVRRPVDGRHHLPDRLARLTHFEVVLETAPADLVPLYLRSLRALGLRLELHDLRFAESDWSEAVLATGGPGWSVRIDGLGVSRISLLQQVAGRPREVAAAEVAYGVERLASVVAAAPSARAVGDDPAALGERWEAELVRQACEVVDPELLRRRLDAWDAEAAACLQAALAWGAYEAAISGAYCLALLDARGVLEGGERSRWQRRLADHVAASVELLRASIAPAGQGRASDAD